MSAAICKKKNSTTTTAQFACKLLFLCHSTEQKLWSIGEETRTPIHLGWPQCELNSKLDFKKKRRGFDSKKPNWTKHSGEPFRATYTKSSAKWDALKNALVSRFSLLFWSYWPKLLQCFLESTSAVNISSQDHFLSAKTGKKISQLERSRHFVARQSWIPNQKKERFITEANCSGAACCQWHHPAELNWDAVMTVARQVRIPNQ